MYLEHFGLAVNPFGLSPKLDFLFKSETFEESMAHLIYGLDNQEAIILITGAIGTGKTMALQSFLMNLGPRFEFALITNTRLTAVELLKMILEDLNVDFPMGSDKSDLLILFKEFMLESSRAGKRVLLVVDEAQNLSSDVLEEIRLLTNLGQGESQPVTIILVGQPELEATVRRPDLAQLRQRIRVHYQLDPLSRKEIDDYVGHRMRVAGCTREVFSSEAMDLIFDASRGVPRLVNTMAGEALLSAFVAGHSRVLASDVEGERELSFESGPMDDHPVAPPFPEARPVPEMEPIPAAVSRPPVENRPRVSVTAAQEPVGGREARPEIVIPARRKAGGTWPIMRGWFIAAAVVLTLGALYFLGFLDGALKAIQMEPEQAISTPDAIDQAVEEQAVDRDAETNMGSPESGRVEMAGGEDVVSGNQNAVKPGDQPEGQAGSPIEGPPTTAETTQAGPALEVAPTGPVDDTYLHISSFRTPDRAASLKKRLDGMGPGVVVLKRVVRDTDWYRVYLGPYATREAAYRDAIKLKEVGMISYYRLATIDPGHLN